MNMKKVVLASVLALAGTNIPGLEGTKKQVLL
ncbi:hypothetical protein BG10_1607 [Bacillus thuringiensis serovar morrisoni]|nr:hypothetical protein BG10_1607 [Bacillus thuringiensis serovar morrisoni]